MFNKRIIKSFIIGDMGEPIIIKPDININADAQEIEQKEKVINNVFADTIAYRQKADKFLRESQQKAAEMIRAAELERKKILESVQEEKERIIQAAEQEKEAIIRKAEQDREQREHEFQAELEKRREEGFNFGYTDGHAEGLKQGVEELKDLRFIVETVMDRVNDKKNEFFSELKGVILNIIFEIAKKVLRREIDRDPQYIIRNIEKAFSVLSAPTNIKIHLNLNDYDIVQEHKDMIVKLFKDSSRIDFIEDKNLERGDCLIETDAGYVDARVDSQLENIRGELELEL